MSAIAGVGVFADARVDLRPGEDEGRWRNREHARRMGMRESYEGGGYESKTDYEHTVPVADLRQQRVALRKRF